LRSLRKGEDERKTKIAAVRSKLDAAEATLNQSQGLDPEQARKAEAKRVSSRTLSSCGGRRIDAVCQLSDGDPETDLPT
jgi:hypothetical protein